MQETTGKKPEKTFIKISKGNVRNDIFLWMHLIRLFLTKIKDYNLKDMWFQQDGNTTLANQPLPQEKFAGCAISRCWCQLVHKILRFNTFGCHLLGPYEWTCLRGQISNSRLTFVMRLSRYCRKCAEYVPKSNRKLSRKEVRTVRASWRSVEWYCASRVIARFNLYIEKKIHLDFMSFIIPSS